MDATFINNKYTRWYNAIIARAMGRTTTGYTERHHIIPKCMGGPNSNDNLVSLTAREHFICHWLLTKMVVGEVKHKMMAAVNRMVNQKNHNQHRSAPSSRTYAHLRNSWAIEHSKWMTGRYVGSDNPNFGNKMSDESKAVISQKKTGEKIGPQSADHRNKISKALTGIHKTYGDKIKQSWELTRESRIGENHPMYGVKHTELTKNKMKEAAAKRWTPEARAAFSAKRRAAEQLKKESKKCQD